MEEERLVQSTIGQEEDIIENILRPKSMEGYVGQEKVKDNLLISIGAAKLRNEALDHVLLYGPPGLGKTTLAHIIAGEMGSQIKITSGPAIERTGDLAAILSNLNDKDVLFIDEIHRLNHNIEEILYPAMEDYSLDLVMGKGPSAQIIQLPLAKFTLIGATTKAGKLSSPLRDRFGVICRLENYTVDELTQIVERSSAKLGVEIDHLASLEVAKRSRGTPRIANRLLKRVRDYANFKGHNLVSLEDAKASLQMLGIDDLGLDSIDIRLMKSMAEKFNGGPCGLETLAATINEDANTIEDVYEPYLLQLGFVARTSRGRVLLKKGYNHIGLTPPPQVMDILDLYDENK